MDIKQVFPALDEKPSGLTNRQLSWTKKGPGRRHNRLNAVEQRVKEQLMVGGMTATKALVALGKIPHDQRG